MPPKYRPQKQKRRIILFSVMVVAITLFLVLFLTSGFFEEGLPGFIAACFLRLAAFIFSLVFILCLLLYIRFKISESRKGLFFLISICTLAAECFFLFFLLKDPIMDIPYLSQPATTYMTSLQFERNTFDDSTDYTMEGTDLQSGVEIFSLTRRAYLEGLERLSENRQLFAKVSYLPHTKITMSLEYADRPEPDFYSAVSVPSDLSDDWQSLDVAVSGYVIDVPCYVSDFIRDGWEYESPEDARIQLAGSDDTGDSTNWEHVDFVNGSGQAISVLVINPQPGPLPVSQCIIGGVDIDNSGLDFNGTDVILPGKILLNWSSKEDVLSAYGQPDETLETDYANRLTYKLPGVDFFHELELSFNESDMLESIHIQNLDL